MEKYEQITQPVRTELDECSTLYGTLYTGGNVLLGELLRYIHQSDGKKMRPLLTLLCARLTGQMSDSVVYTATAYEFLHNATLVHDDIVDDSNERRGRPSVNNLFNNKRAVLVGDYLLSQGLEYMAKAGNPVLVTLMSEAAQMLGNGELLQLSLPQESRTDEQYLEIVRCKTAALFRACAQSGAVAAGACSTDIGNMRQLGEAIGICFQIKDDILDQEIDTVKAEQLLETYMSVARNILSIYPSSQIKSALEGYVEYVIDRQL